MPLSGQHSKLSIAMAGTQRCERSGIYVRGSEVRSGKMITRAGLHWGITAMQQFAIL